MLRFVGIACTFSHLNHVLMGNTDKFLFIIYVVYAHRSNMEISSLHIFIYVIIETT